MLKAVILLVALVAPTAFAFQAGYHADMTYEAAKWAGMPEESAKFLSFGSLFVESAPLLDAAKYGALEGFQFANLFNAESVTRYWDSLMHNTEKTLIRLRLSGKSTEQVQTELKYTVTTTLHAVQSFYSHSNFVEVAGQQIDCDSCMDVVSWSQFANKAARDAGVSVVPPEVHTGVAVAKLTDKALYKSVKRSKVISRIGASCLQGSIKDSPQHSNFEVAYVSATAASVEWLYSLKTWFGDDAAWDATFNKDSASTGTFDADTSALFDELSQFNEYYMAYTMVNDGFVLTNGNWKGDGSGNHEAMLTVQKAITAHLANVQSAGLSNYLAYFDANVHLVANGLSDSFAGGDTHVHPQIPSIVTFASLREAGTIEALDSLTLRVYHVSPTDADAHRYYVNWSFDDGTSYKEANHYVRGETWLGHWTTIKFVRSNITDPSLGAELSLYDQPEGKADPKAATAVDINRFPGTAMRSLPMKINTGFIDGLNVDAEGNLKQSHMTDVRGSFEGVCSDVSSGCDCTQELEKINCPIQPTRAHAIGSYFWADVTGDDKLLSAQVIFISSQKRVGAPCHRANTILQMGECDHHFQRASATHNLESTTCNVLRAAGVKLADAAEEASADTVAIKATEEVTEYLGRNDRPGYDAPSGLVALCIFIPLIMICSLGGMWLRSSRGLTPCPQVKGTGKLSPIKILSTLIKRIMDAIIELRRGHSQSASCWSTFTKCLGAIFRRGGHAEKTFGAEQRAPSFRNFDSKA
eukprot:GFYU01002366.1.p1 GENE.GFYU01002366.1~~GFYU01002366.1.p1  ORF type:complete len:753 (+),score=233.93 GFYU01002366.1:141-2399(+)